MELGLELEQAQEPQLEQEQVRVQELRLEQPSVTELVGLEQEPVSVLVPEQALAMPLPPRSVCILPRLAVHVTYWYRRPAQKRPWRTRKRVVAGCHRERGVSFRVTLGMRASPGPPS